jgi:hypothetical protein
MCNKIFKPIAFVLLSFVHSIGHAQEERLLYQIKKTIYSKVSGQEGSNINLSLLLYDKNTYRLAVNCFSGGTEFNDTIKLHELSYLPVQNSIVQKLKSHDIVNTAPNQPNDILESQSLSTISLMVLEANTFITSANDVNRDSITASFTFKIKIPIFMVRDSAQIQKLFDLVGYSPQRKKTDSVVLDHYIKKLTDNYNQLIEKIDTMSRRDLKGKEEEELENDRKKLKKIEDTLQDKKQEIALFQKMTTKALNYFLVGFAFVKKNEIVINRGFIKTIRMVLQDSIELRYRFGGNKISLSKLNINKIIDYNMSLDIRSVSAAHRNLETYSALWKFGYSNLEFWTKLSEVIQYDPPEDTDITDLFVVKQQRIIFEAGKPNVIRVPETDINNVIQLNVFTDLVGVQEDQPNGLIQIEGAFKAHLFGWGAGRRYRHNRLFFFDHLDANLRFSKIENKLRFIDASIIKGEPKITFIPNFQLLQYANLEVGIKTSIFKFVSYKREFNFYYGAGILRTALRDTIFEASGPDTTKIPRAYNVLTLMHSVHAHLKIKATSYMGVDISARLIWLRLLDHDVKQSGENFSREVKNFQEFSSKKNVLFNPQFQVYYMPNKDESKRLYLRCGFTHDIGTRSNNFLSIQVGLSSDIKKFLNFNGTQASK